MLSDVKDKFQENETIRVITGIDSSVTAANLLTPPMQFWDMEKLIYRMKPFTAQRRAKEWSNLFNNFFQELNRR